MHLKFYAIAATAVVYCMVLVALKGQTDLSNSHYEFLSRQPVQGLQLGDLTGNLSLAVVKSQNQLAKAVQNAAPEPAPPCDPILCRTIREFNDDISLAGSENLARLIEGTANMYGVDPYLVAALVSQESAFYENAVSPVGALGLGQLMPETAADLGVNPRRPRENLDGCVRYLAQNLDMWSESRDPVALALASYNAGPGAVERFGGVPPYEETRNYVAVIKQRYGMLRHARAALG